MKKLTMEQIKELSQFDTPTICNAIESFKVRSHTKGYMKPGMKLRVGIEKPMVGYAVTAKVSGQYPAANANEMLMGYYESIRVIKEPTIAVIQDIDSERVAAFWGEVQATTHMALGAVGTIMDGGVRDIKEAESLGFYFFSTDIIVSHGYTHVESYNCPLNICGLNVKPGDLLHGDCHGVVNIPHEIAPQLAQACEKVIKAELPMLDPCRKAIEAGVKPTIDEIQAWRTEMVKCRG